MKKKNKFKGQSTLEYAVIIFVVVAGLVAMQIYMKRAAEGKLRESSDRVGDQFEKGSTEAESGSSRTAVIVQNTEYGGKSISNVETENVTSNGEDRVDAW